MSSGHPAGINSVACDAAGALVLTASNDDTARLWSVVSGDLLRTFRAHANGAAFPALVIAALSSDGEIAASITRPIESRGGNAERYVWKVVTGELLGRISERTYDAVGVAFSPDAKYAAVTWNARDNDQSSGNSFVEIRDINGMKRSTTWKDVEWGEVDRIEWPVMETLFVGGFDLMELRWEHGKLVKVNQISNNGHPFESARLSPNRQNLAVLCSSKRVWDMKFINTYRSRHLDRVSNNPGLVARCVEWIGQDALPVYDDKQLLVYDVTLKRRIRALKCPPISDLRRCGEETYLRYRYRRLGHT